MQDGEQEAPEQTEEGATEVEVDWGAETQDYVQNRLAELGLNEQEVSEETEAPAAEADAEEEAPAEESPAEEPDEEPASRTARRMLQKEAKLRQEREEFKAERESWQAEQTELLEQVNSFEKSKATAILDPIAHLESIGLDSNDLINLAREVYAKEYPDQISAQGQAEMARIKYERELRMLKRDVGDIKDPKKPKEPDPKELEQQQAQQQYVAEYRRNLTQEAVNVDPEQFPNAAAYAKKDFNDLIDGMYTVAVQAAQSGEITQDLTPQECMERVESWLAQNMPQVQKQPEQSEEPKPTRPKAITNKVAAARPSDKHEADMTYEEIKAKAQERFFAKLAEGGYVRD